MSNMNIEELKFYIINKEILPNILVFKCSSKEAEFVFYQYLHEYSNYTKYNIEYIEDIEKLNQTTLFSEKNAKNIIYIYETKKLDNIAFDNIIDNVWVKCKSVPKNSNYDIINIPRLEEWQIKDYIETLTKLDKELCDKLYNNYKDNLFRLDFEIQKLILFDNIHEAYNDIKDQLYVDSTENSIFDLTNCVIRRDLNSLKTINLDVLDIDVFGFIKILLNNFRYVIDIQLAINPTPEYVGVSSKQFWAIKKYSCNFYSKEELVSIYRFLLTIGEKIKSGYISSSIAIDYILCKIMLLGGR